MRYAEGNFKEHGWSDWSLMPFGHGNGGGGPTREMLERARRMADLDGVSPISVGTAEQFFGHVEAEVAAGAPVPVWAGELYFEMHRGTLTSQSATKVGNRRCERLLREAELWWGGRRRTAGAVVDEIDALWKDVLLQQFHDIIPGSSIAWVPADAEAAHARVADRLEAIIADALRRCRTGRHVDRQRGDARPTRGGRRRRRADDGRGTGFWHRRVSATAGRRRTASWSPSTR